MMAPTKDIFRLLVSPNRKAGRGDPYRRWRVARC